MKPVKVRRKKPRANKEISAAVVVEVVIKQTFFHLEGINAERGADREILSL